METTTAAPTATPHGKVLYTARVHTAGSRDGGVSQSDDHRLQITHTVPGTPGTGTNPEQLLAAGWSACFQGAMGIVAKRMKVTIPSGTAIDAEVDLVLSGDSYSLAARLNVSAPDLPREVVRQIVDAAHQICPYSKALQGRVPIVLNVV